MVGEESSIDGLSQLLRVTPSPRTGLAVGVTGGGAGAGTSSNPPHLALTVALYAHHRLNPRLTYLALRTLTRFAQVCTRTAHYSSIVCGSNKKHVFLFLL